MSWPVAGDRSVPVHPGPASTIVDARQEWSIALTDFRGRGLDNHYNAGHRRGRPGQLYTGGSGMLFVNDIELRRAAEP